MKKIAVAIAAMIVVAGVAITLMVTKDRLRRNGRDLPPGPPGLITTKLAMDVTLTNGQAISGMMPDKYTLFVLTCGTNASLIAAGNVEFHAAFIKTPGGTTPLEVVIRGGEDGSPGEQLIQSLKTAPGNSVISEPRIVARDGQSASMFVGAKLANGDSAPGSLSLNLLPQFTPDKSAVRVSISAESTSAAGQ